MTDVAGCRFMASSKVLGEQAEEDASRVERAGAGGDDTAEERR